MKKGQFKTKWIKDLEKAGLSEEILKNILDAAPTRQMVPGYPQAQIQSTFIQTNW